MTAHDDDHIDAALEALARPEPPVDHLTRVLARTAGTPSWPSAHVAVGDGMSRRTQLLRPRWLLPIAATVAAAVGGAWLVEGSLQTRLDVVMGSTFATATADTSENRPSPLIRKPVDLPVLPPEAYWAMDPFKEWERLRPGTGHRAPSVRRRTAGAGQRTETIARGAAALTVPPGTLADDELGWAGMAASPETMTAASENRPSPLALIRIAPIVSPPIDIAPLAPLDDITVTEITLAPIVVAPVDAQEKP